MVTQTTGRTFPRLSGLPVIGNLHTFLRDRVGMLDQIKEQCGDIGGFQLLGWHGVMINSAEYARHVLVTDAAAYEKGMVLRRYLRPILGDGMLNSLNVKHRRLRKLASPAFHMKRIAGYATIMADHAERAQRQWVTGQVVDVQQEMTRIALGIVGKTLFDTDVLDEADELGRALTTVLRHANTQITALVRVPLHWPTLRHGAVRQAVARLDATIYRLIAERRRSGEDKGDLLSMLIAAQDETDGSLDDSQLHDEAMTILLAGYENTANSLAWTWYLLTQHPEMYERVAAEADAVLGGRSPAMADLPKLTYTRQVHKEAIRLYPPFYVIERETSHDLNLDGYRIPAGTWVIISPYFLHRRADYYPQPLRFDPERFTPANEKRLPAYAYIPFGAGPRICIGNNFAMMEIQIVLAALAQRVRFSLEPGQQVKPEPLITLRPKGKLLMRVTRRL